jgi:hypothetical protein
VDRGGRSIALHGWSVGDGICDCCDGSDEQFNPHANCSNSCFDTRLLDLKAIYPKFRHICRLSQSEVDKMLKQQDNRITSLSSNLRKLRNREQSLEKNRAMQISVPTRFDPPGLWRKLVMGLWDVTFFAPRLPAGVRKTRFDLAMEPIRAESVNASEEIQRINVFSDNAQKIDRCLIPLFGRSYSVGRYGLRFLAEVRHGKRSLGCFRKLLENGNQWYENYEERQSVEMKVVCGPVERWVNVRETGAGKYVSTFATPVMCDDNAIRRLKNLTSGDLDDLRAAARID